MNKFCVYLIYNTVNGKLYVGKSCELEKRWRRHKITAKGGKEKYPNRFYAIHAAMRKYGIKNFIFKIVEYFSTEKESLAREMEWILTLRTLGYKLYNLTNGGEGSSGYKHTPKSKTKMRICNTGKNNPFYGKKHSKKELKKMSRGRKKFNKLHPGNTSGENNPNAKLNDSDIKKILSLLKSEITQIKIAKQFNVTQSHISKIKLGQTRKIN